MAAWVDDQPVYQYEITQAVERAMGQRQLGPSARQSLREKALQQLIDQRLIVRYVREQKRVVTELEFQRAWKRMLAGMHAQGTTLPEYLQRTERSEIELKHSTWYQLAWQALLDHYLTEANLQKHFERHSAEFDGTQLRVAQIFFTLEPTADQPTIASKRQAVTRIRQKISEGELTFHQAAEKHSQAPSAEQGGDIGWIMRHQPMPEAFSRAAFGLKQDQVSQVVVSPLGVHLIKLLEVKPGARQWQAARAELEQAVKQYLFRWAADQQRSESTIERIGSE